MKNQTAYTLQVTVYYVPRMNVMKAVYHIPQLQNLASKRDGDVGTNLLTKSTRSTPGFFLIYSVIVPFSIQS